MACTDSSSRYFCTNGIARHHLPPLLILVMAVMGGLLCIIGLLLFADRNKGIGHEYDCNELFGR
ncbi:hypothetical protein HMPREF0101_00864 [Bacteroides fragilis]|nr:hypothetical protein HMPREF0101_00864 [Bacteroides fragilis]